MTAWAQLLHFYQPPTQTHDMLRRVAEESYRPLLRVLKEHRQAHLAVNMNGVLTESLQEHGLGDVVEGLRELGDRGQVEFVGSGKFHPILPLIPNAERRRSIAENVLANRPLGPGAEGPKGFFPPELCYSAEILPAVASAGYDWVLLSGVACPAEWPTDVVHRVPADGRQLALLFRDDVRSNRVSFRDADPQRFVEDLSRIGDGQPAYVVTAMDAETYGHHIKGWERDFLAATYALVERPHRGRHPDRSTSAVRMVTPGEVVREFEPGSLVEPLPSSWSTTRDDIAAKNPYPLWRAPGNRVHELQWDYVEHCLDVLAVARRYAAGFEEAEKFAHLAGDVLQPALHSCQFWWASRRPMWDVTLIERGFLLLNSVLVYAAKSVMAGPASGRVKHEVSWRLAAANETRTRLERELTGEAGA
jgi:alpha-amylase/alpha-mannosidase (GH57 family)